MSVVGEIVAQARAVLGSLDPAALTGAAAKHLVEEFAELKRLANAGEMLAAGRVAQTGAWVGEDGAFRDVGAWMAHVAGTSVGRARATIETAERVAALPETGAALRAGTLSEVQVDVIASAATADPLAETALLRSAEVDGVKGLKQACARVEAAASTDQVERYERARVGRHLRHRRLSDVEGLLEMRGPIDVTARVMAALGPIESDLFDEARAVGRRELPGALAFDALARMADDSATTALESSGRRAPATVVFRVDHSAFTRGTTMPGEVCEIVGSGPAPVSVVGKVAGDAVVKALITDGTDVRLVSHLGRTIPTRMRTAIEELQPECVIAGCHTDRHLEIDHDTPVADGGRTELANLNRVCHHHHDVKHAENLRIVGAGTTKRFVAAMRAPP